MSDKTSAAAAQFAAEWEGRGYEKGETQPFWLSLLHRVFGIDNPEHYIRFEDRVKMDNTAFIDGFIPATAVMIEQKSLGKSLSAPIRQSDGALLTPFQQAKRYITNLPQSAHPRWLITCNFAEFWVYDMEQPNNDHAVMAAYGWSRHSAEYTSESAAVATLMTLYKTLTTQ